MRALGPADILIVPSVFEALLIFVLAGWRGELDLWRGSGMPGAARREADRRG
jgi:hypothetical protein